MIGCDRPSGQVPHSEDILADCLYDHEDRGQRSQQRLRAVEGLAFHDLIVPAIAPTAGMVRCHAPAVPADRPPARHGKRSLLRLAAPLDPMHADRTSAWW